MFNLLTTRLLALAVLAFFLFCQPAHADELTVPLYKIAPIFKAVDLRCTSGEFNLQIPIPKRWAIKKAVLRFGYINSSALLKQNSQLVVALNDTPLAQLKLDPLAPNGYAEVELPGAMLAPGYNTLNFKVNQHYTLNCETPCAPELWTSLKLEDALITFDYDLDSVPLKLSALSELIFDPTTIPEARLHLITENLTENALTSAGIVTSGAAQRFDYRKTVFSLSNQVTEGMDNILVGEKAFVEGF
jgi:Bacterial cellulose synthase subunit.